LIPKNSPKTPVISEIIVGTIILWYGKIDNIPPNWAICDGRNGTPDLRGRFIMGYDGLKDIGHIGGSRTIRVDKENLPKKVNNLPPIKNKKNPRVLGKYLMNEEDSEDEEERYFE